MDNSVKGAWIIHHGQKLKSDAQGASDFPALDTAAKAGTLFSQMVRQSETILTKEKVGAYASASGLNARLELPSILKILKDQNLIDHSDREIAIIGGTTAGALTAATKIFSDCEPAPEEEASLTLSELTSSSPLLYNELSENISDTFKFNRERTTDFLSRSELVGFVDAEGEDEEKIIFNGNLFREAGPTKVTKVLSTLQPTERNLLGELMQEMNSVGCIGLDDVEARLGFALLSKIRSIGLVDVSFVDNEYGTTGFVTKPDAFHKFVSPVVDDAFDLAKALVAALTYGMIKRRSSQGQIAMIGKLLGKLINGGSVGPATAIGHDYSYLEHKGVLEVIPVGSLYSMKLLKPEIGQIALQVLTKGAAVTAQLLERVPEAPMNSFRGPAVTRSALRKTDYGRLKRNERDILHALRTKGGLR
ncbi:hypothetical protein ACIQYO_26710 [Methylobacterium sp. NPDC097178]|uniref:hypothetical protein n=1 Tax=Methylobacterium TaxID=407 RepID=UPI00342AD2C8